MHKSRAAKTYGSSVLVLDSEKRHTHSLVAGMQANKAAKDAEVKQAATRAADAASGDTRPLDDTGMSLHSDLIIARLTRLTSRLVVRPGNYGTICFFVLDARVPDSGLRMIAAIERGINTEFAKKLLNEDGTLKRVIPGWRRLLARLIREGILTETQVSLTFGMPTRTSAAWRNLVVS